MISPSPLSFPSLAPSLNLPLVFLPLPEPKLLVDSWAQTVALFRTCLLCSQSLANFTSLSLKSHISTDPPFLPSYHRSVSLPDNLWPPQVPLRNDATSQSTAQAEKSNIAPDFLIFYRQHTPDWGAKCFPAFIITAETKNPCHLVPAVPAAVPASLLFSLFPFPPDGPFMFSILPFRSLYQTLWCI